MAGRSSPASGTRRWSSKAMWVRPGWMRGSVYWVLLVLERDVKNTGSRPVSELQTTSPRSFWLKPMTARFSVLKNVLSGRFNARDDFWVVQVPKKPSQLVFVPSMAISQQYLMANFGSWAGAVLDMKNLRFFRCADTLRWFGVGAARSSLLSDFKALCTEGDC